METTVLMKYVKLGWYIAGVNNGTKSKQKISQTQSNQIDRIVVR